MPLSADRAIERYFRLQESLSCAPSRKLTISSGWQWAERCTSCGHGERVQKLRDPALAGRAGLTADDYVSRCSRCGSEWEQEAVEEIPPRRRRAEGPSKPVDATESRLVDLASLRVAIWSTPVGPRWTDARWAEHLSCLLAQVLHATPVSVLAQRVERPLRSVERMLERARRAIEARL